VGSEQALARTGHYDAPPFEIRLRAEKRVGEMMEAQVLMPGNPQWVSENPSLFRTHRRSVVGLGMPRPARAAAQDSFFSLAGLTARSQRGRPGGTLSDADKLSNT
jgi:hypothetical protein